MTPDIEFNDGMSDTESRANLWREVLSLAINDAVSGVVINARDRMDRVRLTYDARNYFLRYNRDFIEVCSLAGLDPEAVRERVAKQITAAPSPEELATVNRRREQQRRAGVVSNLPAFLGTGGGSAAQERTNIAFSEKAEIA